MAFGDLIRDKTAAWKYAMDWADQGSVGARQLRRDAAQIKAEYCTDGLWNPDAQIVYLYLIEAMGMAEECDCQCPSPAIGVALRSMECPLHNENPQTRER
jgi:hypothetical protein